MRRVLMGCLAVTLFACGGPISIGDTDGGGGGGGGGSATSGYGSISIFHNQIPGQPSTRGVSGIFWPNGPSGTSPGAYVAWRRALPADCQITTEGSCELARCGPYVVPTSYDAGVVSNAGTLTVQGPGTDLMLGLNPMFGGYSTTNPDAGSWPGGQTFNVSAAGAPGGVPAFTTSVVAAPVLSFTTPSSSTTTALRGQPLPIAWQPAAGELAVLLIGATQTESTFARCTVASNVSSFNVPVAVTQALPVGTASLTLANTTESVTSAGDWSIHLQAGAVQNYSLTVQ